MKKAVFCLFFVVLFLCSSVVVSAEKMATELSFSATTESVDGRSVSALYDRNRYSAFQFTETTELWISSDEPLASIYLEFDRPAGEWTLTEPKSEKRVSCGQKGFLHEFVDVKKLFGENKTEFVLTFSCSGALAELYLYSEGELPENVQ